MTTNTDKNAAIERYNNAQAELAQEYKGKAPLEIVPENGKLPFRGNLVNFSAIPCATGKFYRVRIGGWINGDKVDVDPVVDIPLTEEQYAAIAAASEEIAGTDLKDGGRILCARWAAEGVGLLKRHLYLGGEKNPGIHASYRAVAADRGGETGTVRAEESGITLIVRRKTTGQTWTF